MNMSKATMLPAVSWGVAAPKKIKYADVAELAASKTSAPGGRRSEFEKAQEQGELRMDMSKATMLPAVSRGVAAPKKIKYADVAELADALDSGSSESNFIWVQVPSSAPEKDSGLDTILSLFQLNPPYAE